MGHNKLDGERPTLFPSHQYSSAVNDFIESNTVKPGPFMSLPIFSYEEPPPNPGQSVTDQSSRILPVIFVKNSLFVALIEFSNTSIIHCRAAFAQSQRSET